MAAWTNHAINQPVIVAPLGEFSLNLHGEIDWISSTGLRIEVIRIIIGIAAKIRVSVVPLGIPGIRVVKTEEPKMGKETGNTIEKAISAKLSQYKTVSIRPASLDAPINDDDSTEFGEIVGDEDAQTPFELFRDKNMRDELSELLEVLDDREREIIFKRFGLDGGKPKTLEEVGKKFGVTRERIRQVQNIALAKLRRALAKREKPIVRRDPIQFLKD